MGAQKVRGSTVTPASPGWLSSRIDWSKFAAAAEYAKRDIPVFPCKPGGKTPLTPNGFKDAITDIDRIREWWTRWPDANVAIPTGERSGLLVLDVDRDKGGYESLEALVDDNEPLPDTWTNGTGGGGRHYVFAYPPGESIRNSTSELGAGLDIRGEGGYALLPPSRTTGPYEVLNPSALADPPEWLLTKLRRPSRRPDEPTRLRPRIATTEDNGPIPEGRRNNTLAKLAGKQRARGMGVAELTTYLHAVNGERCVPPLPSDEVTSIAQSIAQYAPGTNSTATTETLAALAELRKTVMAGHPWTGRGGPTDYAVYAALMLFAFEHGYDQKTGVKISVSTRDLALVAGTRQATVVKSLRRLHDAGLVYRSRGRRGTDAGALVLRKLSPQARITQPVEREASYSDTPLRELLRLRHGAGRTGKLGTLILEYIARQGDATFEQIVTRMDRRSDNVRRVLKKLIARGLVECSGVSCRLPKEFSQALSDELEVTGIERAERYDQIRYELQRVAWAEELKRRKRGEKPDPVPLREKERGATGGGVGDADGLSSLARAVDKYLNANPGDACQPPGWIGNTLWTYDLHGRVTPAEVRTAMEELGGERYLRSFLERSRVRSAY